MVTTEERAESLLTMIREYEKDETVNNLELLEGDLDEIISWVRSEWVKHEMEA